jgi:hypothetical protein
MPTAQRRPDLVGGIVAGMFPRGMSQAERLAKRELARALGLIRHPQAKRRPGRPWMERGPVLLGTMADETVAAGVGRSRPTVRRNRVELGLPAKGPNGVRPRRVSDGPDDK